MKNLVMIYGGVGMVSGAASYDLGTLIPLFVGYGALLMFHGLISFIDNMG
jgi:hypothetical protein